MGLCHVYDGKWEADRGGRGKLECCGLASSQGSRPSILHVQALCTFFSGVAALEASNPVANDVTAKRSHHNSKISAQTVVSGLEAEKSFPRSPVGIVR